MVDHQPTEVRDNNGPGEWSWQSVQERYKAVCANLGLSPRVPEPARHRDGNVLWIYPIMLEVIKGIESGDAACTELGIEFMEADHYFPFRFNLRYRTARALRRTTLTEKQKLRIRTLVCTLLLAGRFTYELREYVRLLKVIGFDQYREQLIAHLSIASHPANARYRLRLGL